MEVESHAVEAIEQVLADRVPCGQTGLECPEIPPDWEAFAELNLCGEGRLIT